MRAPTLRLAITIAAVGLVAAGCSLPGAVRGPVEVTATFDDVGDLVTNHSVQVADVRIGSVTGIELTDDFRAEVTMSIQDGLELPADSVAVLRTTSLLGEKFIELRPRGADDDGRCPDGGPSGTLEDGADVSCTIEAPELEFVAEEAAQLLAGVATNDLATLVQTGAVGFGGRAEELRGVLEGLSVVSATLADQTQNIISIIDGLGTATAEIAAGAPEFDRLLVNLADTTTLLADNRQQLVDSLEALTRLARTQNELVFEPYLEATVRQIEQVDAILARVLAGRAEVGALLDWLNQFVGVVPLAIPSDYAQIYGWFAVAPLE